VYAATTGIPNLRAHESNSSLTRGRPFKQVTMQGLNVFMRQMYKEKFTTQVFS
jgi:hypothetical protein